MYAPFFRCESFPYISRRADWCVLVLRFPLIPPALPLFFISIPCPSLSVPFCFPFISRCFPVRSTSYFLPSFPGTFLHFPFAPQYFPQNGFSSVFAIRTSKNTEFFQIFGKRRQEPQTSKEPAGRIEPGTPLFCNTGSPKTTFSGTRSGGGGGPPPWQGRMSPMRRRAFFAFEHHFMLHAHALTRTPKLYSHMVLQR